MASMSDLGNYSVCESASSILEIDHFQTRTTIAGSKYSDVSSDDETFRCRLVLRPSGYLLEYKQTDPDYVHISLSHSTSPPKSLVQLAVSLIDVKGERQFTQNFGMASRQLVKKSIQARFISREEILTSAATYLHAGTLKVLFEVSLLKPVAIAPLTALTSDYASLLETRVYSDLTLFVGKKAFPVHKLVLSARSPVFARMFNGDFEESKEDRVVLEDMSEQVLQELLNFIYTERVENMEQFASELLIVSDKYQIESLKKICGTYLSATVNTDTLLSLLQLATLYNVPELKSKCLAFFTGHSKEIKLTEEWEELIITEGNQEFLGLLLRSVMLIE